MIHACVVPFAHSFRFLIGQAPGPHAQQVDAGAMVLWLGLAAAVIGAVSVGAYYAHRAALRRRLNSHPALFHALCRVHQLNRGERTLLRQVVRAQNRAYPGQVFTEPGWGAGQRLPAELRAKAAEVAKLHNKLFG